MEEYERKQLLERIEREGATVGASIPDQVTVQGDPVDLHAFVFEAQRRETIPPTERERVERAKRNLRRERLERKHQLEEGDISYEDGEALARSIVGIDRALAALDGLEDSGSIEDEAAAADAADRKRWVSFLRQVLDGEDSTGRDGYGGTRP